MTDETPDQTEKKFISGMLKRVKERLDRVESTLQQDAQLNAVDFLIMREEIHRNEEDLELAAKRLESLKSLKSQQRG